MIEFEFDEDGLKKLEQDLTKAIKKCPKKAKETLDALGKEFKNSARKKADKTLKHTERAGGDKKWAIKRRWGSKTIDEGVGMTNLIWNSAPHFHLIENGHQLVRDGKTIGFVEGKHIMEKTRDDYRNIVPERFEKMVDDILKESDLD